MLVVAAAPNVIVVSVLSRGSFTKLLATTLLASLIVPGISHSITAFRLPVKLSSLSAGVSVPATCWILKVRLSGPGTVSA